MLHLAQKSVQEAQPDVLLRHSYALFCTRPRVARCLGRMIALSMGAEVQNSRYSRNGLLLEGAMFDELSLFLMAVWLRGWDRLSWSFLVIWRRILNALADIWQAVPIELQ